MISLCYGVVTQEDAAIALVGALGLVCRVERSLGGGSQHNATTPTENVCSDVVLHTYHRVGNRQAVLRML